MRQCVLLLALSPFVIFDSDYSPHPSGGGEGGLTVIMSPPPVHQRGGGHNVFGMDPIGVGVKLLVRSVT